MSASISLYRKWRPQTFQDLKGQDVIRDTIFYALTSGQMSQAYLFCGPRGTGKTSTARLIAKFVNCQAEGDAKPCNACAACTSIAEGSNFDILEVDAASNRGIDEIRQLRDSVRFAPTQAKYKVFIIDEVHMLTREAFNALLKTLEEPPSHALFILATTEAHKIPPTIISRCQRYDFRLATLDTLTSHLLRVAEAEGMKLTPDAARFVARLGDGSFRDSLSILDQLRTAGKDEYTLEVVEAIFGYIPQEQMAGCLAAVLTGNTAQAHASVDAALARGADLKAFGDQLLSMSQLVLESLVVGDSAGALQSVVAAAKQAGVAVLVRWIELLLEALQQMKQSPIPRLPLDVAMVKLSAGTPAPAVQPVVVRQSVAAPVPTPVVPAAIRPEATPVVAQVAESKPEVMSESEVAASPEGTVTVPVAEFIGSTIEKEDWMRVLAALKEETPSLVTSLSHAQVLGCQDDVVRVAVKFKMHADKINQVKNRQAIEQALHQVLQSPLKIEAQVVKDLVMEEEEAVDLSEVFDFAE